MDTVLPKVERGVELAATRISVQPPSELPMPPGSRRPYGPGDVIDGKYELEALLGRGGMGEVWTARNATLDVRRAIKLIRTDAGSADSTDRLLNEAQAAARLAEPSIVRVFDFGKTAAGDPYIVMEVLEGENLLSMLARRERLSPVKAVRVLLPMIRALVGAHAHGIVHRDLKPENIFLAKLPDGRVQPKLLDFGIAKLKNAVGLRLTTDGAVMGSPLYMAPEQARGEDVDERADIWALSVVMYEAITGHPPFSGDDRAEVTRAVAESSPARLSHHNVSDDSLWPILSRGLEKRREDRWGSMQELGCALARWLLDQGVSDDITGASLESNWFRSARQSLFSSSSPPLRPSLSVPSEAPALLLPAPREPRTTPALAPLDRLARLARSLPAGAARWLSALREPGRQRQRWGLGAVLLGAALALAWGIATAPDDDPLPRPNALVDAPAAPVPPPAPAPEPVAPPTATLGSTAEAVAPSAPPVSRAADEDAARRGASREPSGARRKAERGTTRSTGSAARDEIKEHRRSKLIDPYR
jgi:eukaryotic-like serine/threonine-protein kinase